MQKEVRQLDLQGGRAAQARRVRADFSRFTLAISTNVVISLGMVGALSIVRYHTAVKDPLDLLYLFWAITTGITAGAGMYALVGLRAVVIVAIIAGFASHQDKARVYMLVINYTGQIAWQMPAQRRVVRRSSERRNERVSW